MSAGEIIAIIVFLVILLALIGGAIKTFRRNWIAALLLLLFLFPIWVIWAFIEMFTGEFSKPQAASLPSQTVNSLSTTVNVIHTNEPESPDNIGSKSCPFCAERIKQEAVFCRFCKKDLVSISAEPKQLVIESNLAGNIKR